MERMNTPPSSIQISDADVQAWRDECTQIEGRIQQLNDKLQQLRQKIGAAEILLGMAPLSGDSVAQRIAADQVKNWIDLVLFALANADGGRSQRYILDVGRETALAERVKRSPNGLYNAVNRMMGRGDLI